MSNSYFFLQAEKTQANAIFLEQIEKFSAKNKQQVYVLKRPLGDGKYSYKYDEVVILLMPKHKITLITFGTDSDAFDEFCEDFIEDLGSISDKFRYRDVIGRPRVWRDDLIHQTSFNPQRASTFLSTLLDETLVKGTENSRKCDLLISLITGSINDIDRVGLDSPANPLDSIKRKIVLFDGDQTRFIYQNINKRSIRIQGLSGTGKTELLLHKLKELYTSSASSAVKIAFTCHNKILADSLRRRIPEFFNFMKVEQQIKWNELLWCVGAWGSKNDPHSGIYRFICDFYGIPFLAFSYTTPFKAVCAIALEQIKEAQREGTKKYAFDYMLIDESQDFDPAFFSLCDHVTKERVIIAGDIFQSIFDDNIVSEIKPDFLLSKCYRTDPRTLMFAHALGMGLFESEKLRWLEDDEWRACGYQISMTNGRKGKVYALTREPLRRFEDIKSATSVEISDAGDFDIRVLETSILEKIAQIKEQNETVQPDDIGVIFLDDDTMFYTLADRLEVKIGQTFGWKVNKAYESKKAERESLFISNKNNVKGLEFPFVICITYRIQNSHRYRNSLYMMLTRSFITTYLITSKAANEEVYQRLLAGLAQINKEGKLVVEEPADKDRIKTSIKLAKEGQSWQDFMNSVFDDLQVASKYRSKLLESIRTICGEVFDRTLIAHAVQSNYEIMLRGKGR